MDITITAEYLIAVLAAMVIVVTFRRKVPLPIELAVWSCLVWVCLLVITSTPNPQARALTSATLWGAGRLVTMVLGLSGQDALHWLYGARFLIAGWVVVLFGLDLFALALVSTKRQANAWPRTKLGEWFVLPPARTALQERAAVSGVDQINERINVWGAAAAAASVAWAIPFFVLLRDVEIPRAARGLKHVTIGGGAAWRRVAAGRRQLGEVRISRLEPTSTNATRGTDRPKRRAAAKPALRGADIVHIKTQAQRAARKSQTVTAPRKTRTRTAPITPLPEARTGRNVSKKRHPQGRLAS